MCGVLIPPCPDFLSHQSKRVKCEYMVASVFCYTQHPGHRESTVAPCTFCWLTIQKAEMVIWSFLRLYCYRKGERQYEHNDNDVTHGTFFRFKEGDNFNF